MTLGRAFALGLVALGCSRPAAPSVELEVGAEAGERLQFSPQASFAEYVELKDARHELRITLAGYAASCEGYVTPPPGRPLVSVVITSPWREPLRAGSYPFVGESGRARSLPTVRIGTRAYDLPPGGSVSLKELDLSPHGTVEGELDYQFPGDATRPATGLRGRFAARLCRVNRAEER